RSRAGLAADQLESALEPGAVALARHLAARTPRARLHLGLALPLAGERLELLHFGSGRGRLLRERDGARENGRETRDHKTGRLHVIPPCGSANPNAALRDILCQ